MEIGRYVSFNAETVRAVSFLDQLPESEPRGQQLSQWLPAGTYKFQGFEDVSVSSRGVATQWRAARLLKPKRSGFDVVYYVSPEHIGE